MRSRDELGQGMFVVSVDRRELGRIIRFEDMSFIVEKGGLGGLGPRDLRVPYKDVDSVVGMRVLLSRLRADYVSTEDGEPPATAAEIDAVARGEIAPEELRDPTYKT